MYAGAVTRDYDTTGRGIYEHMASRCDRVINVAERLLFDHAREWASSRGNERCLEAAVGASLQASPAATQLLHIQSAPRWRFDALVAAHALNAGLPTTRRTGLVCEQ